jgi:DNA polymerase
MVEAILKLEKQGYPVVMHIHDEILCCVEGSRADECLEAMIRAWGDVPSWAPGLVLDADGRIGRNLLEVK